MKLNCLIVDDEPVARKGLAEYVQEVDFLHLTGMAENAMKASALIANSQIDLLFLDIHMPRLTGIEFLKTLKNPPLVIFTTAYSEYALEGYQLDIIDYLVKPIPFQRFLQAAQKARDFHRLRQLAAGAAVGTDYFFIKCNTKYERVNYMEVQYVEAMQNYCIVHTVDRKLITYITLSSLETSLPSDRFLKVHKSYLVAMDKISAIDGNDLLIGDKRVPVSRANKDEVIKKIMGNNLFKR